MKLFKNTNLFYSVLLAAGLFFTACSFSSGGGTTTPSSKTDTGGSTTSNTSGGTTTNTSDVINHDDGNAIAYFLCEELCNSQDETVKLVFYPNGKFAVRATILSTGFTTKTADDDNYCELYGERYDKYRGTYTGDPTKDGALTVNFTEKSHINLGPADENVTSLEEAFSQEWHQRIKYEPYTNTTADIKVTITDDVATFSNGPYASSYSKKEFVRTDANDLGPYRYDGISRRQNDNRRTEWTIPEGYTSVADSAFCRSSWSSNESDYYQYLKKVKLPPTIKKIGSSAFYNCTGLEEINIPEGCTEIEIGAFSNCWSLKEITIPKSLKNFTSGIFSKDSYRTVNGKQEEIPSNLVVRFAEGTTQIPDEAFYSSRKNSLVKSVVIPASVKKIGKRAFSGFSPSEVELPEGLEEIGDYAFSTSSYSEQKEIDELVLPSTLKKIGTKAFSDWKIKKLVISGNINEFGENAFKNIEELVLPKTLKKISDNAFCDWNIKKVEIPEGVEEIGEKAFYVSYSYSYYDSDSDYKLSDLVLPETLKKIGNQAFYGNRITKLVLPDSVEEIGEEAFYPDTATSADNIAELVLPKSLKKVGDKAFLGNKVLKFEFPDGVEEIGSRAFYSDAYSSDDEIELVIPASLKKLASDSFYNGYVKKVTGKTSLYNLNSLIGKLAFRADVAIYCGEEDVTAFFRKSPNSNVTNCMWENEEDGILLTLKSDKTYELKTNSITEEGVWFTEGDSNSEGMFKLYKKDGSSSTYAYEYDYKSHPEKGLVSTLDITNLSTLTKVDYFSVVEKKETTTEKWCENAEKDSSGKYIYYQYYLNKVKYYSSYYEYLNTPVYYRDDNYEYQNKYYKSCKDKIESKLNDGYSYSDTSEYDSETDTYNYIFYLTSDPQQQEED